jgi:hypothetical protein
MELITLICLWTIVIPRVISAFTDQLSSIPPFTSTSLLSRAHRKTSTHLNSNPRPRPGPKHNSSSPNRQPKQNKRTRRKQTKPHHNPVRQRMHKRMHNPHAHISPRSVHGGLVVDSQVGERQDGADEVRRLLVQVVEVLRGPLQVRRQHLLHPRGGEGRVGGDFVFGQGWEALAVHPAFHDEGPEVEGYLFFGGEWVSRFGSFSLVRPGSRWW